MKKYIKYFFIAIFIIATFVLTINYGIDMRNENIIKNIKAERITDLDNYKQNKGLAETYLQTWDIVDENSYQNVKNDLYYNLSPTLQKELFPTVNYEGSNYFDREYSINKIIATNNSFDEENVVLIEYNLKSVNYNSVITNLIFIEKGVITKVTRVK